MPLLYFMVATLILAVLLWPVLAIVRRHYKKPFPYQGRAARLHRWTRVVAIIDLAGLAVYGLILAKITSGLQYADSPTDPLIRIAQVSLRPRLGRGDHRRLEHVHGLGDPRPELLVEARRDAGRAGLRRVRLVRGDPEVRDRQPELLRLFRSAVYSAPSHFRRSLKWDGALFCF